MNKCSRCNVEMDDARVDMGYTICVLCSTEEKKVGHIIYPHKTGAYIQVVDKDTHANLNRLDRRGTSKKTARHYKEFKVNEVEEPKPIRRQDTSSIVHTPYDKAYQQVMDYYDEWGYEPTIKYLRLLNSSGDIPLMTRVKLQDIITDRYLAPSPRALKRKFNKQMA